MLPLEVMVVDCGVLLSSLRRLFVLQGTVGVVSAVGAFVGVVVAVGCSTCN